MLENILMKGIPVMKMFNMIGIGERAGSGIPDIYQVYDKIDEAEEFLSQLVNNVQIYEECKENGQWLKSIEFKLPIIEKELTLSLDNDTQNESVVLLTKVQE